MPKLNAITEPSVNWLADTVVAPGNCQGNRHFCGSLCIAAHDRTLPSSRWDASHEVSGGSPLLRIASGLSGSPVNCCGRLPRTTGYIPGFLAYRKVCYSCVAAQEDSSKIPEDSGAQLPALESRQKLAPSARRKVQTLLLASRRDESFLLASCHFGQAQTLPSPASAGPGFKSLRTSACCGLVLLITESAWLSRCCVQTALTAFQHSSRFASVCYQTADPLQVTSMRVAESFNVHSRPAYSTAPDLMWPFMPDTTYLLLSVPRGAGHFGSASHRQLPGGSDHVIAPKGARRMASERIGAVRSSLLVVLRLRVVTATVAVPQEGGCSSIQPGCLQSLSRLWPQFKAIAFYLLLCFAKTGSELLRW